MPWNGGEDCTKVHFPAGANPMCYTVTGRRGESCSRRKLPKSALKGGDPAANFGGKVFVFEGVEIDPDIREGTLDRGSRQGDRGGQIGLHVGIGDGLQGIGDL